MMENIADELRKAAREVSDAARGVYSARQRMAELDARPGPNTGNSTVTINAGGVGVWISTTACLVCLALSAVGSVWFSREMNRKDMEIAELKESAARTQTYLAAIYAQAPQLNPESKKDEH